MVKYRCGHCGFEGHCYGVATGHGVSAPFCPNCEKNDKLTLLEDNLSEDSNIKPEVNMSERRDLAIGILGKFIYNSPMDKLRDMLKKNGKFNCLYKSPDIKKKWVLTVEEIDL